MLQCPLSTLGTGFPIAADRRVAFLFSLRPTSQVFYRHPSFFVANVRKNLLTLRGLRTGPPLRSPSPFSPYLCEDQPFYRQKEVAWTFPHFFLPPGQSRPLPSPFSSSFPLLGGRPECHGVQPSFPPDSRFTLLWSPVTTSGHFSRRQSTVPGTDDLPPSCCVRVLAAAEGSLFARKNETRPRRAMTFVAQGHFSPL